MTFSVLILENNCSKVIGTLWAADEAGARELAPALCRCETQQAVLIRRAEEREIPFKLANSAVS